MGRGWNRKRMPCWCNDVLSVPPQASVTVVFLFLVFFPLFLCSSAPVGHARPRRWKVGAHDANWATGKLSVRSLLTFLREKRLSDETGALKQWAVWYLHLWLNPLTRFGAGRKTQVHNLRFTPRHFLIHGVWVAPAADAKTSVFTLDGAKNGPETPGREREELRHPIVYFH